MSCDKSFTAAGGRHGSYSVAFMVDVARRHIEGESYRVIARDVYRQRHRKISPTGVQQMVAAVASHVKTPWVMSKELKPHWSGFLVVDEKRIPVRGGRVMVLRGCRYHRGCCALVSCCGVLGERGDAISRGGAEPWLPVSGDHQ